MIINQMTDLIGNTPLLKIPAHVTGLKNIDVYAKLEMMNPFGSVKDRTAWGIVKDDLEDIKKNGMKIIENSSGNTAKSLQAIANIHGIKFKLLSALANVREQKEVMQVMGAEIEEIATANDCFDPSDPNDPQYIIQREVAANPGKIYFPSQFTNEKNPSYHEETTAREILEDLGSVDFFFGGLGTTGSSLGITNELKKRNPSFKSIGVTAALNSFIPGIRNLSQMMESNLFQKDLYDVIFPLTDAQAVDGMLKLARECGVLCGPSSGANFQTSLDYLSKIDAEQTERKTAVFIVCDRMEWYISYLRERRPELFGEEEKADSLHAFASEHIDIVPTIAAKDVARWKRENPQGLIIDTRAAQSFQLIAIEGSLNVPQEKFEKWIDGQAPFSQGQQVLIICAIGERSRHYAAYLNGRGVKAYNLEGGIMAWADHQSAAA